MRKSDNLGLLRIASALLLGGLVLAGCRESEQGRILSYRQGVYLGQADTKLDAAQVERLQARTRRQAGD